MKTIMLSMGTPALPHRKPVRIAQLYFVCKHITSEEEDTEDVITPFPLSSRCKSVRVFL